MSTFCCGCGWMFRLSNERHRDGARVAVKAAKAYGAKGKDMEAQYASLGEGLGLGFYDWNMFFQDMVYI